MQQATSQGAGASNTSLKRILLIGAGVLAVAALLWGLTQMQPEAKQQDAGYYTGVMYNHRTGNYVDGKTGRIVPPPAGEKKGAPLPKSARSVPNQ
jgi:hypothetical protein